ncbi:DUF397 domain-containing protein [Streptomyces sp. NPDC090994]|uniref:DUF397 domain-containing protein n=1 Tax=Streptomyces sp. NPDC090994 TaxID=3365969 RepID=UPI00380ED493
MSNLTWVKSSYSGNEGGACLEIATTPGTVHVRDSKAPARARLAFRPTEWSAFIRFTVRDSAAASR